MSGEKGACIPVPWYRGGGQRTVYKNGFSFFHVGSRDQNQSWQQMLHLSHLATPKLGVLFKKYMSFYMVDGIVDTEATAVISQPHVACFMGEGEVTRLLHFTSDNSQRLTYSFL